MKLGRGDRDKRTGGAAREPRRGTGAGASAAERLEPRVLFAVSAQVNFQPPSTPVPGGYVADVGQAFGRRTGGAEYGWVGGPNVGAVDRNAAGSPDQRRDTFAVLRPRGSSAAWE